MKSNTSEHPEVIFLSTLSLRRATHPIGILVTVIEDFYPRSPCGERRFGRTMSVLNGLFLSTLSLRRATRPELKTYLDNKHFYPRSPCGERREESRPTGPQEEIFLSTLSLRRATLGVQSQNQECRSFLSTLSLRRATAKVHKTVGHFCAYETNFMEIASSC